jgi:hypothetical protein
VFPTRSDNESRQRLTSWVEKASASWLRESNVLTEVVDVRDKESSLPSELHQQLRQAKTLPAAILIANDDRTYRFDPNDADPSLDSVMKITAAVMDSPIRRGLQTTLVDSWCVIVFAPGSDAKANEAARAAIARSARKLLGTSTELGKVIDKAPKIIELSRTTKDESVVLWSLGLVREGEVVDKLPARVVILAGRGETRGPTIEGDDINETDMTDLLTMLGRSCSCTTSPKWLIGTAIPLSWDDATKRAAKTQLGFDPLDPKVLRSIKGATKLPDQLSGLGEFNAIELGYQEIDLEGDVPTEPDLTEEVQLTTAKPSPKSVVTSARTIAKTNRKPTKTSAKTTAAHAPDAHAPDEASTDDAVPSETTPGTLRTLMIALGAIAVVVILASLVLVGRSRKS